MEKIHILTDSSSDIPHDLVEAHGIEIVPIMLTHEGRSFREYYDITSEDYCRLLETSSEIPGTAMTTPTVFLESYNRAFERGCTHLLAVLISSYFLVALVMNPLIVYFNIRRNPYPLVWATIRESGVYAFFTRSSAANIPVNMALCKRLGLNPDTYAISIPLGATINMAGASITISVLALAAANTLGIHVDMPTALLLCIVSTVGACGASGVAGGSLLLIPVACASFGISNDIAMQVVGVGFIISVLEDACETALNSSSDVLFTATAEFAERAKEGTLKSEDLVPRNNI